MPDTRTVWISVAQCLIFMWFGCPLPAWAESAAPHNQLSLHAGLQTVLVRDELLVPLSHSGLGTRLAIQYKRMTLRGTLSTYAAFGFSPAWNTYGHIAGSLDHQLRISHTWDVGHNRRWQLGPAALSNARVNYFYKWDDAHGYWVNTQMLSAALRVQPYASETYRLEMSVFVGLLGLYQRPPAYRYAKQEAVNSAAYYIGEPFKHPHFAWVGNLQSVEIDTHLGRVGRHWSFGNQSQFLRARSPMVSTNLSSVFYASRDWDW